MKQLFLILCGPACLDTAWKWNPTVGPFMSGLFHLSAFVKHVTTWFPFLARAPLHGQPKALLCLLHDALWLHSSRPPKVTTFNAQLKAAITGC